MNKLNKHFDYCILRKNDGTTYVILFNDNTNVQHYLLTETCLRNVDVEIDGDGMLYIYGKEDVYEIALHERIRVDELDSRPEEKFIHKCKGFKFKFIKKMFESYGCEVIVINGMDVSDTEELTADMMSLLTSFSGKFYGKRSAERIKQNKIEKV